MEELYKIGYSTRKIAARLGRHHSSVTRELKRLFDICEYKAEKAQRDYEKKRKNSKPHGKWSEALCLLVTDKLKIT